MKIVSIAVSKKKGTPKTPVEEAYLFKEHGLEGSKIFDQHIAFADEVAEDLHSLWFFKIDADAPFAAIDVYAVRALRHAVMRGPVGQPPLV